MRSGSSLTYIDRIGPAWRVRSGEPDQWGCGDWAEVGGAMGEGFRVRVWMQLGGGRERTGREKGGGGEGKRRLGAGGSEEEAGDAERD